MSAEAGTEEGDELDVLATLADVYQAANISPWNPPIQSKSSSFEWNSKGLKGREL